jgi:cell migration-inducing and hyaluronan-binding protein
VHLRTAIAVVVLTVASVLTALPAGAASNAWSANLPTSGSVVVPSGADLVLDTDLDLDTLVIDGTVRCGDASVEITARWILVNGSFLCGSRRHRFEGDLTVTLKGPGTGSFAGFGDKFFGVSDGGRLELHGERAKSWTRLSRTAQPGDTVIHLADQVWGPGDRIVLAPTNYEPDQGEAVTIASRSGSRVTLTEPLRYQHHCGTDEFGHRSVTECAEVGLLTHNIVIEGNLASDTTGLGGHMLFLEDSIVHMQGIALRRMGQKGVLARYPVHWHMAGHTRGWFKHSSIEQAYNRFVTIHGTHGVTVAKIVGYDTIGHGFYLEDGVETGNRIICNLAVGVRSAEWGEQVTPSDLEASGFWISNPDNVVKRNVAAGAPHAGFSLSFPEHPVGLSSDDTIWPRRTPLGVFTGNTAHSVGFAGLYVDGGERSDRTTRTTWYEPRVDPADPGSDHVTPVFRNFKAWKSRHYGIWIRTFSGARVVRATLADNWRSAYLANIPSGPDKDNVGVIDRSLMVGTTSNKGIPEGWERTDVNGQTLPKPWEPDAPIGGVHFYDGPMLVKRTTLANFEPNATRRAGALSSLFPNEFSISVRNAVEAIGFRNTNRVLFPEVRQGRQGDAGTMFTDLDGSVTGIPGARVVVDPSLLDDPSCTPKRKWHASICQGEYARISLWREDGRSVGADVTRDDGRSVYITGSGEEEDWMAINVQMDRDHALDFQRIHPEFYSFWVNEFTAPGGIRVTVPAPSGHWEVEIWGPNRGAVDLLAELDTGLAGWYHDPSTDLIHIRYTSEARGGEIG